jgi:hypothetical protein
VKTYFSGVIHNKRWLAIILLIILMVAISLIPLSPTPRISIEVLKDNSQGSEGTVTFTVIVNATGDLGNITVNVGQPMVEPESIYIYWNSSLSSTGISYGSLTDLQFSLHQYLKHLGPSNANVSIINSSGLANLLSSNSKALLIIPTGGIPTVYADSLKSWLTDGGLLSWIGDQIPPELLGYSITGSTGGNIFLSNDSALRASLYSKEFDIPVISVSNNVYLANVTSVESHGGIIIGHYSGESNNATDVFFQPVGRGGVLYAATNIFFSWNLNEYAWTIVQVFYSGISPSSSLIKSVSTPVYSSKIFGFVLTLNKNNIQSFSVYGFQNVPTSYILYRPPFVYEEATYIL